MFVKKALYLSILTTIAVNSLYAGNFSFTAAAEGGTNGDWDVPGNWNPLGPPDAGDTATIPSGKTAFVEDADAVVDSISNAGTVEIIDRTLTLGSGSSATTTNGGGTIRFKDVTSARESVLKIEDDTTLSGILIITDAGKVGKVTWADAKTDEVTLATVDIEGSIHFFINADSTRADFNVFDTADEMLIGPDADPDSNDANFNAYTMTGNVDFFVQEGELLVQRMDINGVSGTLATGRSTFTTSNSVSTEILYYSDAEDIANATDINFVVNEFGTLDIKTNVGGNSLKIEDGGNSGGDAVVKVAARKIARFESS